MKICVPQSKRIMWRTGLPPGPALLLDSRLPQIKAKETTNRVSRLDSVRHPLKAAMAAP